MPERSADQDQVHLLLNLIDEIREGADQERVFSLVAETLRQVFGIDRLGIVLQESGVPYLAASEGLSAEYQAAVKQVIDQGPGARALAARRPQYFPDAPTDPGYEPLQEPARQEGFHSVLILPLFAGTEAIGYMVLYHDRHREYTAAEIVLAQALVQQAAFAVREAGVRRRIEAEREAMEYAFSRRVAEVEAIDEIMLRISSSLDLPSTLEAITQAASRLSQATSSTIYLRDPDGIFRARSAYGTDLDRLRTVPLSPGSGLLAEILRHRAPVQVERFSGAVRSSEAALSMVRDLGVQATLGVPFVEDGEIIGVLYVASGVAERFSEEVIRLLQRLAAFAQVAVQNARRFSLVEEERSRLQAYLNAVPEAIIVLDREGRWVMTNEIVERDLGISREVVGRTFEDIRLEPERFVRKPLALNYDTGAMISRVLAGEGEAKGLVEVGDPPATYEAHFSPLRSGDGPIAGVVITLRDITMPLELEAERSRVNLMSQLLDLSARLNSDVSVGVLIEEVVDVAMTLVGAQSGTLGLVEHDQLVFRRFRQPDGWVDFNLVLAPYDGAPGHVWQTGKPFVSNDCANDPIVMHDVQQRLHFLKMVAVPVIDRSGRTLGTLSVYDPLVERDFGQRDVETLTLLAHQVAIAVENVRLSETKDAFLSIVSHELKTPVTSIKGFAQVLQRRLSPEVLAGAGRYLQVINQQSDRLTALINDLLDLSRIHRGQFVFQTETVPYTQLVRSVTEELQMVAPNNPIELAVPENVNVRGNTHRLRQVLVNLIDNAVEHGPAGGKIRVTVQVEGDIVTTVVRDEGPGVPRAEQERIFGPYYQVHYGAQPVRGLGLGLFISRQVVNEHGGRIWVDSEDHTSFCFTLHRSSDADHD